MDAVLSTHTNLPSYSPSLFELTNSRNSSLVYILSIDFKAMINELQRVAEDVRKITKFSGEPNIILLVYEAVSSPCSERYGLKELFKNNDVELIEFDKNLLA